MLDELRKLMAEYSALQQSRPDLIIGTYAR
jgi:hypothetical protein